MNKKILLLTASLCLSVGGLVACGGCGSSKDKIIDANLGEYHYSYEQEFVDPCDDFMKIDGVLDEELWQNQNYLNFRGRGVDLSYTAALTEKGVYIAGIAKDTGIFYYGRFDMHNNSGFTFHVAGMDVPYLHPMYRLRLETDPYDERSYSQNRFQADSVTDWGDGTTTVSMTSEVFVSWDSLNIDVSQGIPDTIKIEPVYRRRYQESDNSIVRQNVYPIFSEPDWLKSYFKFNANGYINVEQENCVMGNAANGHSKTDGWDISDYENGNIYNAGTTRYSDEEVIFYKGVNAKNAMIEATVEPLDMLDGSSVGLIMHSETKFVYRVMNVSISADTFGKNKLVVNASSRSTGGTFTQSTSLYTGKLPTAKTDMKLRMIKWGGKVFFFVNDEYVYSEDLSSYETFAQQTSPGLYANKCKAKFTNYTAKALTDEEVLAEINGLNAALIETPNTVSGGRVTATSYAVRHGEEYTLKIEPALGFVLSGLTINGEDCYEDAYNCLNGREYKATANGTPSKIVVQATFKSVLPTTPTVWEGNIVSEKDETIKIPNAAMVIQAKNCPLLYYVDGASNNGSFYIDYLPKKGDIITQIDGQNVVCDGEYAMMIQAGDYNVKNIEFTMDESFTTKTENIALKPYVLGGSVSTGEFNFTSDTRNWDMLQEANGVVTALKGWPYNPLVFTGVSGRKAVIEYTYENRTPPDSEEGNDPAVGIVIKNKAYQLGIVVVAGDVRVMPKYDWNLSTKYTNDLGYNTNTRNQPLKLRFIHDGDMFAVFVQIEEEWKLAYSAKYDGLNVLSGYAITAIGGTYALRISDFSIKVDAEASKPFTRHCIRR